MTPKIAKDDKILPDLNGITPNTSVRVTRRDVSTVATSRSRPVPERPSVRTKTQASLTKDTDTDKAKTSIRKRPSTASGVPVATSKPGVEHARAATRNTNTTAPPRTSNTNNNKDTYRCIDVQDEPSLMPPNRAPSSVEGSLDTSEEEGRRGVPSSSSSTSTTSSFLQAAAIPPRLTTQQSAPGAVCVPGLSGLFDNDQHDNLLDMEEEDDNNNNNSNNNNNNPNGMMMRTLTSRRSTVSTLQSPQSTSFTFYSQSTTDDTNMTDLSMSIPIVAELAPSYSYNEQDVEDRLAERLEARLEQEVDRRLSQDRRQHAIAEVVSSSNGNDYTDSISNNEKDENFKICGIRRTSWGMILCVIMLLVIGGVTGTYLWFSRVREEENNTIDGANNNENDRPLPQSSPAPTNNNVTDNTSFPSIATTPSPSIVPTASTISPMPSSPSTINLTKGPNITETPPSLINLTTVPTATPLELNGPSTAPTMYSTIDRRWDYLITSIGPYIVPDNFVDNPEKYFVTNTNNSQYAALGWIAALDLETDIFAMPIQLLVQRYVLAVLYYSTGGARIWTESLSFLSSNDVCDWNNDNISPKENINNTTESKTNVTEEDNENTPVKKGVFCSGGPFVTSIQIPSNSLQGKIPWELSLLEYLIQIDFDTNELYGSIPVELSRLSRLQALWFKANDLTGALPLEFANATKLASIDLEDNSLTSTLPSEWGSLSNLFYVSLRLNNITGSLPPEWHELSRLNTFDLEGNKLDGTLPEEYGELTELVSLYFESNRFEGPLPPTFGNLTNLVNLFLDDNLLSGTVPTEYSALTNLEYFWFHGNILTGSVNEIFCDSYPWLNGTDLRSDCLSNDSDGLPAQIECSCCTRCCDINGTNCADKESY